MQEHTFAFEVAATPEEVWRVLHAPVRMPAGGGPRVIEHGGVRIEIQVPGDADGRGLVRRCTFAVPRWLLSGGVGRSWECVVEADPPHFSRYEAIGKPLWSEATGWHRIEAIDEQRSRVEFGETYRAFNPVLRVLLERRVHRYISRDNDRLVQAAVTGGLARLRAT